MVLKYSYAKFCLYQVLLILNKYIRNQVDVACKPPCMLYRFVNSPDVSWLTTQYMYVNSLASSVCQAHFRQLTRNENVARFHPHSFKVTHLKNLNRCAENITMYFLNNPTDKLLKFKNNLKINLR